MTTMEALHAYRDRAAQLYAEAQTAAARRAAQFWIDNADRLLAKWRYR